MVFGYGPIAGAALAGHIDTDKLASIRVTGTRDSVTVMGHAQLYAK